MFEAVIYISNAKIRTLSTRVNLELRLVKTMNNLAQTVNTNCLKSIKYGFKIGKTYLHMYIQKRPVQYQQMFDKNEFV